MKERKIFWLIGFACASAVALFPQRVVSMAPAITEIVFALGKGDRLVGVTKFCDYPAKALTIAKVGGFLDVNLEAIMALGPDIIIAYPEQREALRSLNSRALVLVVKHRTLSDLYDSILKIGQVLGDELAARGMVSSMRKKLADVTAGTAGKKRLRVLIIAGRNADELKNMFIVGKDDFLNELLEIAGGTNAYQGAINYPNISLETVIALDPDLILEISAFYEGISDDKIFSLWRPCGMLRAVRGQRIRIIKKSFWLRPGARVAAIAEELAGIMASNGTTDKANDGIDR